MFQIVIMSGICKNTFRQKGICKEEEEEEEEKEEEREEGARVVMRRVSRMEGKVEKIISM